MVKAFLLLPIISLFFFAYSAGFSQETISGMDKMAIAALNEEKEWTVNRLIKVHSVPNAYFKKHKIFKIQVVDVFPASTFYAAISEDKNKYLFLSYEYGGTGKLGGVEKFSKLIKDENKEINRNNVKQYLKAFLFLVDKNSSLIERIEDIVFASKREKRLLSMYRNSVKPVEYTVKSGEAEIVFYSWGYGIIYRWKILIKQNGEILSSNRQELYAKSIRMIE